MSALPSPNDPNKFKQLQETKNYKYWVLARGVLLVIQAIIVKMYYVCGELFKTKEEDC